MRLFASVALLSLTLATSSLAQTASEQTPAPTPSADKKVDAKKDGVVCHKEIPTGSQFPVKVCTSAADRKAERGAAQRAQETMQSGAGVVPN